MKLTAKQRRQRQLLLWIADKYAILPAAELALALDCEHLPRDDVPTRHDRAVTEFRHLPRAARVAVCQAFINQEQPWTSKPSSRASSKTASKK